MLVSGLRLGLPKKPKDGKFWNMSAKGGSLESGPHTGFQPGAGGLDQISGRDTIGRMPTEPVIGIVTHIHRAVEIAQAGLQLRQARIGGGGGV